MLVVRGDIQTARSILFELRRRNPTNPQYDRLLSELGNPAFAQPTTPPALPSATNGNASGATLQDLLEDLLSLQY